MSTDQSLLQKSDGRLRHLHLKSLLKLKRLLQPTIDMNENDDILFNSHSLSNDSNCFKCCDFCRKKLEIT